MASSPSLETLRHLSHAATAGAWRVEAHLLPYREHAHYYVTQRPGVSLLEMNGPCLMYANAEADAAFIVAAVEYVRARLADAA